MKYGVVKHFQYSENTKNKKIILSEKQVNAEHSQILENCKIRPRLVEN